MSERRALQDGEAVAIQSEIRELMADPARLEPKLAARGYTVSRLAGGFLALPADSPRIVLLAPLHEAAAVSMSGPFASGRSVARCGAIVAAMRSATASTALLFPAQPIGDPSVLPGCPVLSLEGGVTPRIWPGCFGSVDLLVRCIGRPSQHASPNTAINAVEGAIPILMALHQAAMFRPPAWRGSGSPDAPLASRLSIVAAHGGTRGAAPTLFDIVLTRRYTPDESVDEIMAEIDALLRGAADENLRVELSVLGNTSPVEDPTRPHWSREAHALDAGWHWPQTPFRTNPALLQGAIPFGGLDDAGTSSGHPAEHVSLEDIAALSLSLTVYLSAPAYAAVLPEPAYFRGAV